jgi:diphthine-ammonia ligase
VKLAALFSGGKDSTYAAVIMEMQGHEISCLVSILPSDRNSWIFHTPNLHLVPRMAEAMGKPLVTASSSGTEDDDLRALETALLDLDVDGVVTGALASDYQWDRINGVCEDLGFPAYSPLWRKDQEMLMRDMLDSGLRSMIVVVSAEGLDHRWLGRCIDERSLEELKETSVRYGFNISGEGGEYETLVLDSQIHQRSLEIIDTEIELQRDGGRLTVRSAELVERK